MNIEEAKALGADCDNCPLRDSFNAVPTSHGSVGSIAIVGEAPGVQEARQGKSFVGPSGKLLDIVLDHHGIDREEVTVGNACMCRPPDGGAPPKSAIQACRQRLHDELDRADTLVALGNSAALSLLGTEGITKLRVGPGKSSPYESLAGKRIIPTVHPAACLRQSDMFPHLVTDIGKIEGVIDAYEPPHWELLDDPVDAIAALKAMEDRKEPVYVDIEVDIEKDTAFDHPNRYDLLCVGLGTESGGIVVLSQGACASEDVRDALGACLRACPLDAQNGKFDLAGLYPIVGPLKLSYDTMLASYCLDERPGIHGLKVQAVEYLGAPEYDKDIKKYVNGPTEPELEQYHGYGRIPRHLLYEYNAYDIDAGMKLKKLQIPKLEKLGKPDWWDDWYHGAPFKTLRECHDFLVEAGNELMYLELNGIAVSKEANDALWEKYESNLEALRMEAREILKDAGFPGWKTYNPNSPQQVKAALLSLNIKVLDTTADTIQRVKERLLAHPTELGTRDLALEYIEVHQVFKKEAKLFGTYVKGLRKRMYGGRVYSTFMLHGSTTGRLASRNPNLQNIPRLSIIKDQFVPAKEGNVFVQADYSQAELRVLTWMAQEEYFREILNDPTRDLFDELTPQLYGTDKGKDDMSDAEWKELRIRVKAFVYGLGYGRTHFSIAQEFRMPEKEALRMKDEFFRLVPSVVEFQKETKRRVQSGQDLITPFGRHRRFHLITRENWKSIQNEALAFQPQSTSSDICLRAMAHVRRDLSGSGAYVRNIVHDSILVDCPPDMADDVAKLLDRRMVESAKELVGDYIDFATEVKIGKTWGEV